MWPMLLYILTNVSYVGGGSLKSQLKPSCLVSCKLEFVTASDKNQISAFSSNAAISTLLL